MKNITKPVVDAMRGIIEAQLQISAQKVDLWVKMIHERAALAAKQIENADDMTVRELLETVGADIPYPIEYESQVRIAGDAVVDSTDRKSLTFGFNTANVNIGFSWGNTTRRVEQSSIEVGMVFRFNGPSVDITNFLDRPWRDVKDLFTVVKGGDNAEGA